MRIFLIALQDGERRREISLLQEVSVLWQLVLLLL
jgi:hypothetical protein